jgi:hypothetical protein
MKDEGAAHSKDATKKTGFKYHIVARGSLTGFWRRGCWLARRRPVVSGERESGEVHFVRKLDKALQCSRPRVERRCPRHYMRYVLKTARQRLEQLFLLSRRAKKNARLFHVFSLPS